MSIKNRSLLSAGLLAAGSLLGMAQTAQAQTASPQHYFDETTVMFRLRTPDPMGGYVFRLEGVVYGVQNQGDAVRVDLKQNGRVLQSVRCPFVAHDDDAGKLECESEQTLAATGEITAEILYLDDSNDSATVFRTMNLTVNRYPAWQRNEANRSIVGSYYQISGDDLPAGAFVWHGSSSRNDNHQLEFNFWITSEAFRAPNVTTLRCTVNGQRIPDIEGSMGGPSQELTVEEWTSQTAPRRVFHWYMLNFATRGFDWGVRPTAEPARTNVASTRFAGETPGAWVCALRADGQVMREFRFSVDAQGRIPLHPEQQNALGLHSLPTLSWVDTRIPSPSSFDIAVNPTAIRRSMWFGHRYADTGFIQEMFNALPAAVGSTLPTSTGRSAAPAATTGRRRGRR